MVTEPEFWDFINRWLKKAENIQLNGLSDFFDKYFTLFVVYNRLYAMATFILATKGEINIKKRTAFPDGPAATDYVGQFLGAIALVEGIENHATSKVALDTIIRLIDEERFYIKLDMVTGDQQRPADEALLRRLRSTNKGEKATAILETIYAIRCNMFHGHKGFHEVQKELLDPAISILERLIELLKAKFEELDGR